MRHNDRPPHRHKPREKGAALVMALLLMLALSAVLSMTIGLINLTVQRTNTAWKKTYTEQAYASALARAPAYLLEHATGKIPPLVFKTQHYRINAVYAFPKTSATTATRRTVRMTVTVTHPDGATTQRIIWLEIISGEPAGKRIRTLRYGR